MPLLLGGRWRPLRVTLMAAALAASLAAYVYCHGTNRGHVILRSGVVISANGHDLDQPLLDGRSNREAVTLPLVNMASKRARQERLIDAAPAASSTSVRRDNDTGMLAFTVVAVSGAKGPPNRGAFIKDPDESVKRQPVLLAHSFFSRMKCRFSKLMSNSSDDIKTEQFLECCSALSAFFDLFGTTAFKAVKATLVRYIKAINLSYLTSPKASYTLQELVLREEVSGVTTDTKTCCDVTPAEAVLWLFRGLEFVAEFLTELRVQSDLSSAGLVAYERSLKPYHGFLLRTAFSVALNLAPYRDTFIMALASTPVALGDGVDGTKKLTPELERALFDEMQDDVKALHRCYVIIKVFYKSHNLDWEAVA